MAALLVLLLLASLPSTYAASSTNGWKLAEGSSSIATTHELSFWLQAADPAGLESALLRVSTPSSPTFRQWLDDVEIAELVAPPAGATAALRRWLDASLGGRDAYDLTLSRHGDFAHVVAATAAWSRAFDSPLAEFTHHRLPHRRLVRLKKAATTTASTSSSSSSGRIESGVHVAPSLKPFVRAIFGLSDFYPTVDVPQRHRQQEDKICNQFKGDQIDPRVISERYHNPYGAASKRAAFGKHAQGVAAFEDAQFMPSDVKQFQSDYALAPVNVSVLGPNNGGYYGEASLDTQYIFSTGSGVETWYISQEEFDLLKWSWLVMNMTRPPAVLSVSWGNGESNFDVQHQHAASAEFAKMGAKGHSVLTASGDDGTGGHGGLFSPCKQFDPTWPASSPYVTSVGGTYLQSNSTEIGWSFSGGGFSSVAARPAYQDDAVKGYVAKTKLPPASHFNSSGRVTPDVSALSTNFRLLSLGSYGCLSGTSAATPVFAGMISLLNDELVSQGKPTVGFINPALYQAGAIGFDITVGNNKGQHCPAGFNAEVGFDAVTGLGSPEFQTLRHALL
eukprot:g5157.t1